MGRLLVRFGDSINITRADAAAKNILINVVYHSGQVAARLFVASMPYAVRGGATGGH